MKHIRIIVGGTGSGKDHLVKELSKSKRRTVMVRSYTTRKRRDGEDDSKYIFDKELTADNTIEVNTYGTDVYGLSKDDLINKLNTKDDLSIILDPNGVISLLLWLKNNPSKIKVKFHLEVVFLHIPRVDRFENLMLQGLINNKQLLIPNNDNQVQVTDDSIKQVREFTEIALDRLVRNGDDTDRVLIKKRDTIESIIKEIPNARIPFIRLNGVDHIIELTNRDEISRFVRISIGKRYLDKVDIKDSY